MLPSVLRPAGPQSEPFTGLGVLDRSAGRWFPSAEAAPAVPPAPVGVRVLPGGVVVVAAADGLWRSADQGRTWRRTAAFPAKVTGFGLGVTDDGVVATAGAPLGGATVVYSSHDGATWTSFATEVSLVDRTLRLRDTSRDGVGFAYLDVRRGIAAGRAQVLRTVDGGRHWAATAAVGVTGIAFVPGSSDILAAVSYAADQPPACDGHLARSEDDGATWHAVPGTCTGQELYAVGFIDAEHGFAAGGTPNHYAGSQLFYATADGGRTWSRRYTTGATGGGGDRYPDAFTDLAFTSPTVGYAIGGGGQGAADGPCGGPVQATTDGGRSWHNTGVTGLELSAADGVVAVTGGGYRPVGGVGAQVSTDRGATWRRSINPDDVTVTELSRSTTGLLAQTNAGLDTSTDGGLTWQRYPLAAITAVTPNIRAGSHGVIAEDPAAGRLGFSADHGRTWTPSRGGMFTGEAADDVRLDPADDRRAVAYAARSDCSTTVFASTDTGRTWSTAGSLPFAVGAFGGPHSGYDNHLAAAVGQCANRSYYAVSHDDGHTWTTHQLGYGYDLIGAGVADGSVWLTGADNHGNRVVMTSPDQGASWTVHDLIGIAATSTTGDNGWPELLTTRTALLWFGDGTIWRTTDAGATWRQERPNLIPTQ